MEENANVRNYDEEISLIWRTINTLIENTQDQMTNLKIACTPTNHLATNLTFMDVKTDETTPKDKKDGEKKGQSSPSSKKPQQEKDLKTIIVEVKDDVHNQILGVSYKIIVCNY